MIDRKEKCAAAVVIFGLGSVEMIRAKIKMK